MLSCDVVFPSISDNEFIISTQTQSPDPSFSPITQVIFITMPTRSSDYLHEHTYTYNHDKWSNYCRLLSPQVTVNWVISRDVTSTHAHVVYCARGQPLGAKNKKPSSLSKVRLKLMVNWWIGFQRERLRFNPLSQLYISKAYSYNITTGAYHTLPYKNASLLPICDTKL